MTASAMGTTVRPAMGRMVFFGVIGGLVGGVIFGVMMALMDMLPMVAALIGQTSAITGFIVHMGISAIFGAAFGVIAGFVPRSWAALLIAGVVYGIVLWVGAALVAMPLMLGMNDMVFQIGQPQIMSLMGHLIFGVTTAAIVKVLAGRTV